MIRFSGLCAILSLTLAVCSSYTHAGAPPATVQAKAAASARKATPSSRGKNGERAESRQQKYKAGELLVRFKQGVPSEKKSKLHKKHGAEKLKEFGPLGIQHLKLKKGMSVEDAVQLYKADPDVRYAEPNFAYEIQAQPNDPGFAELWALQNTGLNGAAAGADIKAPAAWDITTGTGDVVVAVIDTGIDYTHPDLQANLWVNGAEIPGNALDDDGNGCVDDIHGINAITGTGDPFDDHGHGTHVAGTIGAAGNNETGVVGVNWNVKIMACKFLDAGGSGYTSDAITCLQYIRGLKDQGVPVVASNNSWGGGGYSQALSDAIDSQADILFVASAGNSSNDADTAPSYPAAYPSSGIISVAATDSGDQLAEFSNFGRRNVDLAAPGVNILSTVPQVNRWNIAGGYGTLSGTSMAAPHVTGVVALLKAAAPERDWRALRNLVLSGGDPLPPLSRKTVAGRRLNAYGSLTCSGQNVFSALQLPADLQPGVPAVISALSIACGAPLGGVEATSSAGETIVLHDDGIAPDAAAGDGTFSATWIPQRTQEKLVFSSPAGSETVFLPAATIAQYLPAANLGLPYRQTVTASGVTTPLQWSVLSGALPPGLTLDAAGEITGTATEAGIWPIQLAVTDALGQSVSRSVTLHVVDSQVVEKWAGLKGTLADEAGYAVAADALGNSYVATTMFDRADLSVLLIKYAPSGRELWAYRYDGAGDDYAWGVAVNAAGEALVAGRFSERGGIVLKFSPSGELLREIGSTDGSAYANDIAIGADQTIYVAGETYTDRTLPFAARFSPEGEELWSRAYLSPIGGWANAVAVDPSGNVFAAGTAGNSADNEYDYLLLKYDPSGNLLWAKTEDGGTKQDWWEGVAVDSAGNPYVSGHRIGMMVTRRYDPSGNMLWSSDFDAWGTPNGYDIAVDSSGRAYVAGFKNENSGNFHILCYAPTGEVLWSRTSDSGGPPDSWEAMSATEGALSLALGPTGQIFATGYIFNGIDFDILTIEYGLAPLTVKLPVLPPALLLLPYSYPLAANGFAPFTWEVTSGALPEGVALAPASGELRGTPTVYGTFTFTVRVSDVMGRVSEQTATLSTINLTAGFDANRLSGYAPLLVNFTDTTVGAVSSWAWDFGDGTGSSKRNPSHIYKSAGSFSVSLTAANALGSSTQTATDHITVFACMYEPARIQADGVAPVPFAGPQGAYAAAADAADILLQAYDFPGDLELDRDISVKLKGGYDCLYSWNPTQAGILGKLAVKNGKVSIQNLKFK